MLKKLFCILIFLIITPLLFSQVVNNKVYMELIDENNNEMGLLVRDLPTTTEGWINLTNHIIGISNIYRKSLQEINNELRKQSLEIHRLELELENLQTIDDNMSQQQELVEDIQQAINARKFKLYYGVIGEYTYLGYKDSLYGLGMGLRWTFLTASIVPGLRINDGNPSFGIGLRLGFWF